MKPKSLRLESLGRRRVAFIGHGLPQVPNLNINEQLRVRPFDPTSVGYWVLLVMDSISMNVEIVNPRKHHVLVCN